MNCKPGDLAVIVQAYGWGRAGEISHAILGRIVRVTHLAPPTNATQCLASLVWNFEQDLKVVIDGVSYMIDGITDDCLRPIRDPGDDARDEMLRPLPSEMTT